MNKSTFVVIAALVIIVLGVLVCKEVTYYSKENKGMVGKIGRLLNKTNTFKVHYENIDPESIDVLWNVDHDPADTIVKKGEFIQNFGYVYGVEQFQFYYENKKEARFSFFSSNNNVPHDVEIWIVGRGGGYSVKYRIDKYKPEMAEHE